MCIIQVASFCSLSQQDDTHDSTDRPSRTTQMEDLVGYIIRSGSELIVKVSMSNSLVRAFALEQVY